MGDARRASFPSLGIKLVRIPNFAERLAMCKVYWSRVLMSRRQVHLEGQSWRASIISRLLWFEGKLAARPILFGRELKPKLPRYLRRGEAARTTTFLDTFVPRTHAVVEHEHATRPLSRVLSDGPWIHWEVRRSTDVRNRAPRQNILMNFGVLEHNVISFLKVDRFHHITVEVWSSNERLRTCLLSQRISVEILLMRSFVVVKYSPSI
jgi:hypothetical protein